MGPADPLSEAVTPAAVPGAGRRQRLVDAAQGALLFGLAGPPLGSLLISVPMAVAARPSTAGDAVAGLALPAVLSYVWGLVPAALVGAAVGWHRDRLGGWRAAAVVAAAAAALATAFDALFLLDGALADWGVAALSGGVPGFWAAGLLCRLYGAPRRRPRQAQRSSASA